MFVFPPRLRLSEGERRFLWALFGVAVLGAVLASVIVLRLAAHGPSDLITDPFAVWTILAGATGSICGFLSTYNRWLGFSGKPGALRAIVGGLMISFVGAVAAGTLILPYYGTMFGPFQLIIVMIEMPALGVLWIMMLACAHKLVTQWRTERESIFLHREPTM